MVTMTAPEKVQTDTAQHRKMSYEKYLEFAGDSQIVEWSDGEVIIYTPPQYRHQAIISFLGTLLKLFIDFFDQGIIIYTPFEVKLWPDGPSREPDIIFIAKDNLAGHTPKRFEGGPDLVVEIISPASVTENRVHKFTEYERAGVREYWLIDPRPHQQQADFYLLGQDKRYHPAPLDENGLYHSTVIPGFWLKIDWLWPEKLPDPHTTFAEIIVSTDKLPDEVSAAYQTIQKWLESKK